jgi:hypothetical protein
LIGTWDLKKTRRARREDESTAITKRRSAIDDKVRKRDPDMQARLRRSDPVPTAAVTGIIFLFERDYSGKPTVPW